MTRRTQPTDLGPPPPPELAAAPEPPEAPSLPVLCDEAGRAARAVAGRVERAAADLAGPARDGFAAGLALGHQDVWRFEADARRAAADLLDLANHVANWRRQRDAEVARA